MQINLCRCDFVRNRLLDLRVYGHPYDAALWLDRLFSVLVLIKPDLIVQHYEPLVSQILCDFLLRLAVRSITALLELDIEQLC